jgi:hypothetical protein
MIVPKPHTGVTPCVFEETLSASGRWWKSKYLACQSEQLRRLERSYGPEVRSLTQGLVHDIVRRETETVDFKEDMVPGNGLWNVTFDYYHLIGIFARRHPRVTKYEVFHLRPRRHERTKLADYCVVILLLVLVLVLHPRTQSSTLSSPLLLKAEGVIVPTANILSTKSCNSLVGGHIWDSVFAALNQRRTIQDLLSTMAHKDQLIVSQVQ